MNYNDAVAVYQKSPTSEIEGGLQTAVQRNDIKREAENAFRQAVCYAKLL